MNDTSIHTRAKLFRGLADPSRARVLEALRNGPRCVSDLVKATGLSQPNLSMHLACLRDCGLVRARRNWRFMHYELADQSVARLLETADHVLGRVAKLVEECPRYKEASDSHGRRTERKTKLRVRRT